MTVERLVAAGRLRQAVPLGPMTTYRFGGDAAWFAEPADESELSEVVAAAHDLGLPIVMLGRGSNVVVSDEGVQGVVVRLAGRFASVAIDPDGVVDAGGATPLAKVARLSVDADRGGLEFLVGIPGSVGGAVRMNAGCLGSETADWMIDASIVSISTGERTHKSPADLEMAYRHSTITDDDIVVGARFRTVPQPSQEGSAKIREVTQWRRRNQPGGTLNAGSVFKNPPGDAAGRIIDSIGLKGHAVGGIRVSPRHANFFEAHEGATAQDVFDLVRTVRSRVLEATGIELEPEVEFLGPFRATRGSER